MIFKKIWIKKRLIEKYNQCVCNDCLYNFSKDCKKFQKAFNSVHLSLTRFLFILEKEDPYFLKNEPILLSIQMRKLETIKTDFENLLESRAHDVRMFSWMYKHRYHKNDSIKNGADFKNYYLQMKEKYELEYKLFDISLEIKKFYINQRKKELENDFREN